MAYIGNIPAEKYISITSQTFTTIAGTGYTLSSSVTNSEDIALFLNNVRQKPSTYTATGTSLTMSEPTTVDDELYCVYLGKGIQTVTPPSGSVGTSSIADLAVTTAKLAGDAVTTAKILDDNVTTAKILDDNVTTAKILDANVTTPKANFISTASGAGVISKGTSGDSDGYVQLNCSENSHGIKLKSPPHSAAQSYTLTFPQTAPATDKYLQTDASGNLSFATVTEYDDDAIQNDIATLALHQATNANAAKYNLVNTNVDQFEDSSGVSSFTDCARVEDGTQQYVASAYESFGTQVVVPQATGTAIGDYTDGGGLAAAFNGTTTQNAATGAAVEGGVVTNTNPKALGKDWGSGNVKYITGFKWWSSSNDGINSSGDNSSGCSLVLLGHSSNDWTAATTLGTLGSLNFREMTTEYSKLDITRGTGYRYHWVKAQPSSATASNSFCAQLYFYEDPATLVDNATGNFISTATVANASVSKVGIVMTYKNNVGTNTLNTDIVAEVSADGGSNYSTVTLEAAGTFSTGILQAVANDVSVTAGTNIQYRISFANQSASVKEARIYGVSLIY